MLREIDRVPEIKNLARHFEEALHNFPGTRDVEAASGTWLASTVASGTVSWSRTLDMHWRFFLGAQSYDWSIFKVGDPRKMGADDPENWTVQFSFPNTSTKRKNRGRLGVAFGRDESDEVWLLHRGLIGGGKKGIGKTLFWNYYRGSRDIVSSRTVQKMLAVVGKLGNPRFPKQVSAFVHSVKEIKDMGKGGRKERGLVSFSEENPSRKKRYMLPDPIERDPDHALVVNELEKQLGPLPFDPKSSQIDLALVERSSGEVKVIFEVETDVLTSRIYEAIGQLYFYSLGLRGHPRLVAVFPRELPRHVIKKLKNLKIDCLLYGWRTNGTPFFNEIPTSFVARALMS